MLFLGYAGFGALIRVVYGIYSAYSNYQQVKLSSKRVTIEFAASVLFGLFGALILNELGFWKVGANIIAILAGLLGANLINLVAKRIGAGKQIEVNVIEKIEYPDLNPNQQRAIGYMKAGKSLTTKIYQQVTNVSRRKAQWELVQLVEKGYVKRAGKGKETCYKIAENQSSSSS
jgi:hypothetical protein